MSTRTSGDVFTAQMLAVPMQIVPKDSLSFEPVSDGANDEDECTPGGLPTNEATMQEGRKPALLHQQNCKHRMAIY